MELSNIRGNGLFNTLLNDRAAIMKLQQLPDCLWYPKGSPAWYSERYLNMAQRLPEVISKLNKAEWSAVSYGTAWEMIYVLQKNHGTYSLWAD